MPEVHETVLLAATRPSIRIVEKLAAGTSGSIFAMLLEVSRNFTTPGYSVGKLREKLGVHYGLLCRFRAAVGVTPGRLIRECRMETAMRLLRDTLLSVDEIAILVGYNSKRALERLCRRWCGLAPSALRHSLRPVKQELIELSDEVFSWYFWERYHYNILSDDELGPVIEYLERQLVHPQSNPLGDCHGTQER